MIYDKSLSTPAYRVRRIKRQIALFKEEQGALYASGVHFREKDGAIVMAEGAVFDRDLPLDCVGLTTSSGYEKENFYRILGGDVRRVKDDFRFNMAMPNKILVYRAQDGKEKLIGITDRDVYFYDGEIGKKISSLEGGSSGCLAYERLFIAKGEGIRWSNPLQIENFEESLSGAGYADLPSYEGNILEMTPFKEKILLVREHGITVLTVKREPITYRAESVPCAFGKIFDKTIELCGEKMLFLTESGLCAFDGSHIKRIIGCGFEEIDLTSSNFNAASVHGSYYAAVTLKDGKERIWVVDPVKEEGHFVCVNSRMMMGGDELYFGKELKLYRLTERGIPYNGESAKLTIERTLLGLSPGNKFLDAVSFDGEGFLTLEAVNEHGKAERVFGRAGERLRFKAPLRGVSFSFHIETACEGIKIRRLTFDVREEKR